MVVGFAKDSMDADGYSVGFGRIDRLEADWFRAW